MPVPRPSGFALRRAPLLRTRPFSTRPPLLNESTRTTQAKASSNGGLAKVVLGLATGVALSTLYFTASTREGVQPSTTPKASADPRTGAKPKVDAHSLAIELREALGGAEGDKVSTDPEILHVHGYSENDYHPGTSVIFVTGNKAIANIHVQDRHPPLSCILPLQMTSSRLSTSRGSTLFRSPPMAVVRRSKGTGAPHRRERYVST